MSGSSSTLVVLVVPELLGDNPDADVVYETVHRVGRQVRALVLVSDPPVEKVCKSTEEYEKKSTDYKKCLDFAGAFCNKSQDIQIIVAPNGENRWDNTGHRIVHMPKGSNTSGYALALSDVLVVASTAQGECFVAQARRLGKYIVEPRKALPTLPAGPGVSEGLDPRAPGWRAYGRWFFGRLEQFLMRLLSLDVFCERPNGLVKGLERLFQCLWVWSPKSWFPDEDCNSPSPDRRSYDRSSPLVTEFDTLDRSAVYGSYIHRDQIWLTHILAMGAVIAAIFGKLNTSDHTPSAWWELAALMAAGIMILMVRHIRLQDRWTACRLGAEQLRIVRMCIPVMVAPKVLNSEDLRTNPLNRNQSQNVLSLRALAEVKRAARDHGLPQLDGTKSAKEAAQWLLYIINDQIAYHKSNHATLERAERRIHQLISLFFVAAIIAVIWEIIPHLLHCPPAPTWLLYPTAALPACAAALHGAATRLGIVQRISLSELALLELRRVHDALIDIAGRPAYEDQWADVQRCALDAADAMGRENESWHGLVRLQRDTLPA